MYFENLVSVNDVKLWCSLGAFSVINRYLDRSTQLCSMSENEGQSQELTWVEAAVNIILAGENGCVNVVQLLVQLNTE